MKPLINGDGISDLLRQVAGTCLAKAKILEEAWVQRADPRAVQGGTVCEDSQEWRLLATQLKRLALSARELVD